MPIENILIIDDEPLMRNFLLESLKRKGYEAVAVESGEKALPLIELRSFDMIITDLKMPGLNGMEILKKVKEISPHTLVIVMTGYGTIDNAVEAMKAGAFHYLLKPFSPESLAANIEKAKQYATLLHENDYLRGEIHKRSYDQKLVAESPAMKQILLDVEKIAKSQANVFIQGETGTGKEVIAHLIHSSSTRAKQPYIRVNCAAVPETLIESEFFGHEKGSFTGAVNKRLGRFELANTGTLLLDEVTEIPHATQPKLLRAIQEMEFERVGGTKPIKVDVRLISTSNRDLQEAIATKTFREDLYYRLNVVPILLPPLRDRTEDIIPLAEYFIEQACRGNLAEKKTLAADAKKKLLSYNWPGNIRELANIMERAVVLSTGKTIKANQLFLSNP